MKRNHLIIIRFSGQHHPIRRSSIAMSRRPESPDSRPIFQPESPDDSGRSAAIVRNRQAKRPDRQIPRIRGAAISAEFDGIKIQVRNASRVFEKGDPKGVHPADGIQRLANTLIGRNEEEELSRIADYAELRGSDYNISPQPPYLCQRFGNA